METVALPARAERSAAAAVTTRSHHGLTIRNRKGNPATNRGRWNDVFHSRLNRSQPEWQPHGLKMPPIENYTANQTSSAALVGVIRA